MANFPKSENDVVGLAEAMVDGYTEYGEDFPGVAVLTLETALTEFKAARAAQESARGQARIATTAKNDKFAALVELMKNDLKVSEVDTADDPDKLSLIGWGTKSPGTPIAPPTARPICAVISRVPVKSFYSGPSPKLAVRYGIISSNAAIMIPPVRWAAGRSSISSMIIS